MAAPPSKRVIATDEIVNPPSWLEKVVSPVNAFIKGVSSALDRGLTLRENFAGEVRVVEVTPPEDWVTPPLALGWNPVPDAPPLAFRKQLDGTVQVRGRTTRGSAPTVQDPIIPIPGGWEPEGREVFDCYAIVGATYTPAVMTCHTGALRWLTGGYTNLSLSGDVEWTAVDRTPPRWVTPVDVKLGSDQTPFPGRPSTVTVLRCKQKRDASLPAPVAHIDWEPVNLERQKSAPGIRIHRVWGLEPGITYTLTLHITPE